MLIASYAPVLLTVSAGFDTTLESQGSIAFPNKPSWLIDLDQRPKDTKCMVEP